MTMKSNWSADAVEYKENNGLVINVHWSVTGEEDGFKASYISTSSFEGDPPSPDFVPYENLQESTVLKWVKDSLGTDGLKAVDEYLKNDISLQKDKISIGTPWVAPAQWEDLPEE